MLAGSSGVVPYSTKVLFDGNFKGFVAKLWNILQGYHRKYVHKCVRYNISYKLAIYEFNLYYNYHPSDRLCKLRRSRTPMLHSHSRPPITPVIRSSEDGTLRISIKASSMATYTTILWRYQLNKSKIPTWCWFACRVLKL